MQCCRSNGVFSHRLRSFAGRGVRVCQSWRTYRSTQLNLSYIMVYCIIIYIYIYIYICAATPGLLGWRYQSNATCLIRPRLRYVSFAVSVVLFARLLCLIVWRFLYFVWKLDVLLYHNMSVFRTFALFDCLVIRINMICCIVRHVWRTHDTCVGQVISARQVAPPDLLQRCLQLPLEETSVLLPLAGGKPKIHRPTEGVITLKGVPRKGYF